MKRREMASAGVAGQRRERGICPLHLMGVSACWLLLLADVARVSVLLGQGDAPEGRISV